ncbi:MAG: SCO family protein [Bacteroidota bacterium]
MTDTTTKKYIRGLAFLLFIVVLPLGSYFYLFSGRNFYRDQLALMKPKAQIDPFVYQNSAGRLVSSNDLLGKVWIASFLESPCTGTCLEKMDQLKMVQDALKKDTARAKMLSHIGGFQDIVFSDQPVKIEDRMRGFWLLSNPLDSTATAKSWEEEAALKIDLEKYRNHFALIDDSLRVRNFYLGTNLDSVRMMLLHMAMIMPQEKKKEIGFEREKEK